MTPLECLWDQNEDFFFFGVRTPIFIFQWRLRSKQWWRARERSRWRENWDSLTATHRRWRARERSRWRENSDTNLLFKGYKNWKKSIPLIERERRNTICMMDRLKEREQKQDNFFSLWTVQRSCLQHALRSSLLRTEYTQINKQTVSYS